MLRGLASRNGLFMCFSKQTRDLTFIGWQTNLLRVINTNLRIFISLALILFICTPFSLA